MTDGEPPPGADEPDPDEGSDPPEDADSPAEAPADDAEPAEDVDAPAEDAEDDADPPDDADAPAEPPEDDADPSEDADMDDDADPSTEATDDASDTGEEGDSPADAPVDEPLPPVDAEDDRIDAPADADRTANAGTDEDGATDEAASAGDESADEHATKPTDEEAADAADEEAAEAAHEGSDEGAPDPSPVDPAEDPPLEADPVADPPMETDLTGAGTPAADADEGEAGEAAADDAGADSYGTEVDAADLETSDTSELGPSAPDDEELPLAVHIEEMVKRLLVVIAVMAVVSVIVFPLADRLINFIWFSFLPGSPPACSAVAQSAFAQSNLSTVGGNGTSLLNGSSAVATNATGNLSANTTAAIANGSLNASQTVAAGGPACPRLYHPLSLVLARLKVASLVGFVIALPVFVYQTYAFMRPGLYPNERRYYLASVPTSLVLAAIGIAFAHLLVLPVIFTYFVTYSEQATTLAFGLQQTFDLMLLMFGLFAVVFQIPLFIMLAIMMGVTSREWLTGRRLYFWAGFAGIAFLFAPEPTGMAPFLTAATMILLFEITLLLLRWTGR